jgi:hypothetical protein
LRVEKLSRIRWWSGMVRDRHCFTSGRIARFPIGKNRGVIQAHVAMAVLQLVEAYGARNLTWLPPTGAPEGVRTMVST